MANCAYRNTVEASPMRNRNILNTSSTRYVLPIKSKRPSSPDVYKNERSWLQRTVLHENKIACLEDLETVSVIKTAMVGNVEPVLINKNRTDYTETVPVKKNVTGYYAETVAVKTNRTEDYAETVSVNQNRTEDYAETVAVKTNCRADNIETGTTWYDKNNKENIGSKGTGISKPRQYKKLGLLKLNDILGHVSSIPPNEGYSFEVLRETIPPPTPFKDESARINIESLDTGKCATGRNTDRKDRRVHTTGDRKEVSNNKSDGRSKKNEKRKNFKKGHGRSKSLSDIKLECVEAKNVKKMEVEKVRKIELEPLRNPTVRVAPGKWDSMLFYCNKTAEN